MCHTSWLLGFKFKLERNIITVSLFQPVSQCIYSTCLPTGFLSRTDLDHRQWVSERCYFAVHDIQNHVSKLLSSHFQAFVIYFQSCSGISQVCGHSKFITYHHLSRRLGVEASEWHLILQWHEASQCNVHAELCIGLRSIVYTMKTLCRSTLFPFLHGHFPFCVFSSVTWPLFSHLILIFE